VPDDDRLGDLGSERKSAAERLAELDDVPEESPGRPDHRDPRSYTQRYMWVVGVAALILIIVATVTSGQTPDPIGLKAGTHIPPFAAPAADSGVAGDANVRPATGGSPAMGSRPACDVHGPGIVNVCDLTDRPLVVTFVTKGCQSAFDAVESVREEHPKVNFVGVISGVDDPAELQRIARAGGWGFPIASDPDAVVFSLYRAGDCPTTVTAATGGKVVGAALGPLSEERLSTMAAGLEKNGEANAG
jgi:hypothetical protein